MALRRVRIMALRCLVEAELTPHPACNFIYGPNGAGKTSLLEGIYLLGRGRSFRTRQLKRLVRKGAEGFAVYAELGRTEGGAHRLGIAWREGKLERRLDGAASSGTATLAEVLAVHVVEPGIHELIQGPPSERRRFLDWGVFHVEPTYLDGWRQYRRVLGQRNAALKAGGTASQLAAWTDALLTSGKRVHAQRETYMASLVPGVRRLGSELLGQELILDYRPGWPADATWEQAVAVGERRDRELGVTAYGPHRADVTIRLEDGLAQHEASRGQQKLAAAALVIGQSELAARRHTGASALLVDDPAAELDRDALERLLEVLRRARGQRFLTALSEDQLPRDPEAAVFHVERGTVKAP
jgi:DNA replication and repair protein RecF